MRSRYVLNEVACHPHDPSSASNVNVLYACIRFQGLSEAEARQRLLMHGPNELAKDPPRPFWKLLLAQFSDMLVMMLIVAAIISGALGQIAAAGIYLRT